MQYIYPTPVFDFEKGFVGQIPFEDHKEIPPPSPGGLAVTFPQVSQGDDVTGRAGGQDPLAPGELEMLLELHHHTAETQRPDGAVTDSQGLRQLFGKVMVCPSQEEFN